jgi:hypothetical protein
MVKRAYVVVFFLAMLGAAVPALAQPQPNVEVYAGTWFQAPTGAYSMS